MESSLEEELKTIFSPSGFKYKVLKGLSHCVFQRSACWSEFNYKKGWCTFSKVYIFLRGNLVISGNGSVCMHACVCIYPYIFLCVCIQTCTYINLIWVWFQVSQSFEADLPEAPSIQRLLKIWKGFEMQRAFTGGYKLWVGQPGEQKQQGNTSIDTRFAHLCEQVLTSVLISSECVTFPLQQTLLSFPPERCLSASSSHSRDCLSQNMPSWDVGKKLSSCHS